MITQWCQAIQSFFQGLPFVALLIVKIILILTLCVLGLLIIGRFLSAFIEVKLYKLPREQIVDKLYEEWVASLLLALIGQNHTPMAKEVLEPLGENVEQTINNNIDNQDYSSLLLLANKLKKTNYFYHVTGVVTLGLLQEINSIKFFPEAAKTALIKKVYNFLNFKEEEIQQ